MENQEYLFNDEEMRRFIIDGYIKIQTDFPADFHKTIFQQVEDMFENQGNLGNNLLPLIPEIQQVFSHPAVHGALTSALGENYVMHSHRYCHFNQPGSTGQNFHKDSYEGDEQIRRHRCRWMMGFYYPQDTTQDMGPTAVLPATQYYETHESAHAQPELALCGEAGTVTLVHYDLWHRAMPNQSDKKRHMLKFLFTRLDEPKAPSWNSADSTWQPPNGEASSEEPEVMWRSLWNWFYGKQNGATEDTRLAKNDLPPLIAALGDKNEVIRLNAAYELGTIGAPAVPALIETWRKASEDAGGSGSENESSQGATFALSGIGGWSSPQLSWLQTHATYAMSAIGGPAVPALINALQDKNESIRASAAYALGDIGSAAQEAVPALTQALPDESTWVRRHATEALGLIGQSAQNTVPALIDLLYDEHYWIRDNAARALARLGPAAEAAIPALMDTLNDENRYVRFHATFALKQIGTPEATNLLFDHLLTSRWCPLTTSHSAF